MTGTRAPSAALLGAAVVAATVFALPLSSLAEPVTRVQALRDLSARFESELAARRPALYGELLQRRTPAFAPLHDDIDVQLAFLGARNHPFWLGVDNLDAAKTVAADDVWPGGSGGFTVTGSGATLGRLGIWDAGGVRLTHVEFGGRATQVDSPGGTHYHSTHCAGTLIASGVDFDAKGMSNGGRLSCWDWNSAESEMATAAASGLWLSSHSYGYVTGWYYSSGAGEYYWYGDRDIDDNEDYGFGFYSSVSQDWDQIAHDAPYYLVCKSAGNDRNDGHTGGHYHWDSGTNDWQWSTDSHQDDGADGGFDTVSWMSGAKNILTVGAVDDIPGGYSNPGSVVMSSFSCWGPTDDGRIKPDVVANGISLWSTLDGSNNDYASLSGTSMSTPSACGATNLIVDYHGQSHSGSYPTAAMMKAILVQTADEAGANDGPDYSYGWGLVNTLAAVQLVADDASAPGHLVQATLDDGTEDTWYFTQTSSGPVRISIAWTDPPGTPPADALDPPDLMLVNDLDLRLRNGPVPVAAVYEPWVLNPASPASAATTGDNFRDNVEQIHVANLPAGDYEVTVSHKATLSGGDQDYAIASSAALTDTPPAVGIAEGRTADGADVRVDVSPNPFRAATTFAFTTPQAGRVRVDVLDVAGRVVTTLEDRELAAGPQRLDWNGRDDSGRRLASGVYFARVEAPGANVVEKVVLLRGN